LTKSRFKGGVHPPDRKDATRHLDSVRAPLSELVLVPVSQHLGAPCVPLVSVGDRVERGQVVGDVDAMVSAPVHSPVSGTVKAIAPRLLASGLRAAVVSIAPDPEQDWESWVALPESDDPRVMVRAAGIVGMGGAAFPTTVKLTPPHDMPIDTLILNGCECEPYLTCDHRVMLEYPEKVIAGARIMAEVVGAERVVVGIEDNKPDAAEALRGFAGTDVEILVLPTNYPQGAEKQLILAVLGKEVPHGKLPAATGALVQNVGTAAAVSDAVRDRKPLMERIVTVTGRVAQPANYLTPIGTTFGDLITASGGFLDGVGRVISGGPMTGFAVSTLDVPVVKGTSGIVVLAQADAAPAVQGDQPCIRCGRCALACPMALLPYQIGTYANQSHWDGAEAYHALDCIECGCCGYVCPTRRPLVQLIRRAKLPLMERGAKL